MAGVASLCRLLLAHCLATAACLRQHPGGRHDAGVEAAPVLETILVAVNVHEKPEVVPLQMANINARLGASFSPQVALSCNEPMKANLSGMVLPRNVHINPEVIEKRRFDGSLLRGIVSNLRFLNQSYPFSYALVLSSKSRIEANITKANVEASIRACGSFLDDRCGDHNVCHLGNCHSETNWDRALWKGYKATRLAEHIRSVAGDDNATTPYPHLVGSPHEGLVMDSRTVERILRFLDKHPMIEMDLFKTDMAMEEFALQTLAHFVGGRFGYMGSHRLSRPHDFYKVAKVPREARSFEEGYVIPRPKKNHEKKVKHWRHERDKLKGEAGAEGAKNQTEDNSSKPV